MSAIWCLSSEQELKLSDPWPQAQKNLIYGAAINALKCILQAEVSLNWTLQTVACRVEVETHLATCPRQYPGAMLLDDDDYEFAL